eukprot:4724088-Pleurochrysis_carterae.AAC.1
MCVQVRILRILRVLRTFHLSSESQLSPAAQQVALKTFCCRALGMRTALPATKPALSALAKATFFFLEHMRHFSRNDNRLFSSAEKRRLFACRPCSCARARALHGYAPTSCAAPLISNGFSESEDPSTRPFASETRARMRLRERPVLLLRFLKCVASECLRTKSFWYRSNDVHRSPHALEQTKQTHAPSLSCDTQAHARSRASRVMQNGR